MKLKSKKSQFLIISFMFILLLLLFIYSLETDNTYIPSNWENTIVLSFIEQTCYLGKMVNGTYINQTYVELTQFVSSYCDEKIFDCELVIQNNTLIPPQGNFSLLNYTHYDYTVFFSLGNLSKEVEFRC